MRVDLELCVREQRVLEPLRVGQAGDNLEVDLYVDVGRSCVNGAALRAEKFRNESSEKYEFRRLPVVVNYRTSAASAAARATLVRFDSSGMGEFDLFEVFGNLFAAHANMSDVRVYARPGRDPKSISLR